MYSYCYHFCVDVACDQYTYVILLNLRSGIYAFPPTLIRLISQEFCQSNHLQDVNNVRTTSNHISRYTSSRRARLLDDIKVIITRDKLISIQCCNQFKLI